MIRKKNLEDSENNLPVPDELPPVEGLDEQDEYAPHRRPHIWLWTLITALAVILLVAYVALLAALGFYDGLKDRTRQNQREAQEHYVTGLQYLESGEYELAIAEFEEALRHDTNFHDARFELGQAKELAKIMVTPTSETRRDAASLLYKQAVAHYENGNLAQAVAVLDELHGLDAEYQGENVETMLVTAHYQLGLGAVREDLLDDAQHHFERLLAIKPEDEEAQDQLNLIQLYSAALNYWERDWAATIQALKGLHALAPNYKDVESRLHDAYIYHAQAVSENGDWCLAAQSYAAAVEIAPLETTVDLRDEAQFHCRATAEAPTPTLTPIVPATPTPRAPATGTVVAVVTARPTARANATPITDPQATPDPEATATAVAPSEPASAVRGQGQIAFTSFDAVRRRHDVYVINLAQGDAKLLRENARQPAMAPGGQRLSFRNMDPMHQGLAILDLRDNSLIETTSHAEDANPAWSPDAQLILFGSNKHGDRKWRIYNISPGAVRGEGEQWVYGEMPAWSADGAKFAYHGCDERGDHCGIWTARAGGSSPAVLTTSATDTTPAWSPNGQQIAFMSARSGNWELYVVDVTSGQEKRLTDHPAIDVSPTWSPDGRKLAFLSNREGGWAVYVLDVRSGQVQKVIATGDAYPEPLHERLSWKP